LGCGLALSTDLEGDSTWDIGVSLLKTALNRRAGELRLAAQIGESPLVLAESAEVERQRRCTYRASSSRWEALGALTAALVEACGPIVAGRQRPQCGRARPL
jgi:hypothetical protein